MQITYNNTTINLLDNETKEVLLSLSGGCDSSSLFFLLCTHFPKLKIRPFNCLDIHHPFDTQCARDIYNWMKRRFPEQDIEPLEVNEFDDLDPNFHSEAENYMKNNPNQFRTIRGVVKVRKMYQIHQSLLKKYPEAQLLFGQTKNPSFEDMKNYDHPALLNLREHRRDKVRHKVTYLEPFNTVDKKFIADIFKSHNLMDSLFTLTGSCVGTLELTDGFTKPCKECWWCHEKRWAFGTF